MNEAQRLDADGQLLLPGDEAIYLYDGLQVLRVEVTDITSSSLGSIGCTILQLLDDGYAKLFNLGETVWITHTSLSKKLAEDLQASA